MVCHYQFQENDVEQLTQGGSRPLADDQLQRAWINDLIIESGTPLSIEDIDAELDRYALYRAEQAPKRPYRVEDSRPPDMAAGDPVQ